MKVKRCVAKVIVLSKFGDRGFCKNPYFLLQQECLQIDGEENLSEIVFYCYLGILILGNGGAELDPPAC